MKNIEKWEYTAATFAIRSLLHFDIDWCNPFGALDLMIDLIDYMICPPFSMIDGTLIRLSLRSESRDNLLNKLEMLHLWFLYHRTACQVMKVNAGNGELCCNWYT